MRLTFALAHLCVWSGILEVSLAKSWPQPPLKWFSPLFLTLNNLGKALAVHGEDHCICHSLTCCGKVGAMEVRFSKWLKEGDMNLVLCISTLHNLAKVFAGWEAYCIYVWFETSVAFSKLSYVVYFWNAHMVFLKSKLNVSTEARSWISPYCEHMFVLYIYHQRNTSKWISGRRERSTLRRRSPNHLNLCPFVWGETEARYNQGVSIQSL